MAFHWENALEGRKNFYDSLSRHEGLEYCYQKMKSLFANLNRLHTAQVVGLIKDLHMDRDVRADSLVVLQEARGDVFNREDDVHVDMMLDEDREDKRERLQTRNTGIIGGITVPPTGFGYAEVGEAIERVVVEYPEDIYGINYEDHYGEPAPPDEMNLQDLEREKEVVGPVFQSLEWYKDLLACIRENGKDLGGDDLDDDAIQLLDEATHATLKMEVFFAMLIRRSLLSVC